MTVRAMQVAAADVCPETAPVAIEGTANHGRKQDREPRIGTGGPS